MPALALVFRVDDSHGRALSGKTREALTIHLGYDAGNVFAILIKEW